MLPISRRVNQNISRYTIQCQIRKACHHTSSGDIHFSCYFHQLCFLLPQLQHVEKTELLCEPMGALDEQSVVKGNPINHCD